MSAREKRVFDRPKYGGKGEELSETLQGEQAIGLSIPGVVVSLIVLTLFAFLHIRARHAMLLPWPWELETLAPSVIAFGPIVFIALVVKPLLARSKWGDRITKGSLVTYYNMITFGVTIIAGFVGHRIFNLMGLGFLYLASGSTYKSAYNMFSPIIFPRDQTAVLGFWLGNGGDVPWKDWFIPIIVWTIIYAVVWFMLQCISTLIRRRWTDHEHLQYPIATTILLGTDIRKEETSKHNFWSSGLMKVGFVISAVFVLQEILHTSFPVLPYLNRTFLGDVVRNAFRGHEYEIALTTWPEFNPSISPMWLGFGYFVSLDILFSVWFFYVAKYVFNFVCAATGVLGLHGIPGPMQQFIISSCVLGILLFVQARRDIFEIAKIAFGIKRDTSNIDEPLSYRVAFWGLVGGGLILVLFFWLALGVNPLLPILFFMILFGASVAIARMRTDAGIGWNGGMDGWVQFLIVHPLFGGEKLGMRNVGGMGFADSFSYNYLWSSVANMLEGMKMADEVGMKRKSMVQAMWIAFIFCTLISFMIFLPYIYQNGANQMGGHTQIVGKAGWEWTVPGVSSGETSNPLVFKTYAGVVGFTILLYILKSLFMWWPLNPTGYVAGVAVFAWMYAGAFFLVWLIKIIVLRYGGGKFYNRLKPLFVGLVLGDVTMSMINLILGIILGFLRI